MGLFHLRRKEVQAGIAVKDRCASCGLRNLFAVRHLRVGGFRLLLHFVQHLGRVFQRFHNFLGVTGQVGKPQGLSGDGIELIFCHL